MPYIKEKDRPEVDPTSHRLAVTPGELNFQLTRLCNWYIESHGLSYAVLNDVLGALLGTLLEFYRRKAVPYEDQKIVENGDVL